MQDEVARAITAALQSATRKSGFMTVAEIYEAATARGHRVSSSAIAGCLFAIAATGDVLIEGVRAGGSQEEGCDPSWLGAWRLPKKDSVRKYRVGWLVKSGDEVIDEGQTSVGGDEDYVLQEFVAQVVGHLSVALSDGEIHHDNFFHHIDSLRRIDIANLHGMKEGGTVRYRAGDGEFWIECVDA